MARFKPNQLIKNIYNFTYYINENAQVGNMLTNENVKSIKPKVIFFMKNT